MVCLVYRRTRPGDPRTSGEEVTGIDLGLTTFAMLANGEKIENPRFFRREEKELAKVQRRLSKETKGTPERAKRRLIVAKVHDRIANKRKNFIHRESRKLVNRFKLIVFEDLKIKNMQQNSRLSKSIADVSWGMMVTATQNKAEEDWLSGCPRQPQKYKPILFTVRPDR